MMLQYVVIDECCFDRGLVCFISTPIWFPYGAVILFGTSCDVPYCSFPCPLAQFSLFYGFIHLSCFNVWLRYVSDKVTVVSAVVGCEQFQLQSESQMCNFSFQLYHKADWSCIDVQCSHHLFSPNAVTEAYTKSEQLQHDTINPISQNYTSDTGHYKVRLCQCGHSEIWHHNFSWWE
jgi:hypothetical protein